MKYVREDRREKKRSYGSGDTGRAMSKKCKKVNGNI